MGGLTGGGGSKGGGVGGGDGLSGDDFGFIQEALGQSISMMHDRYKQLGLGVPDPGVFGGDPATAAKVGGSLQYGSPGTAERGDISGLQDMANATLGQLQQNNQSNPAIPGSPANQIAQNQQLSNLAGQASFGAGQAAAGGGGGANLGTGTATL